jgi:hypothetical protein
MRHYSLNDQARHLWRRLTTKLHSSMVAAILLVFAQIASAANPSCTMTTNMSMNMSMNMAASIATNMPANKAMAYGHDHHKVADQDFESTSPHIGHSEISTAGVHHDGTYDTCATACDCSMSCASATALQPASLKVLNNTLVATAESLHRPRQLSGFSPRHFRPPTR